MHPFHSSIHGLSGPHNVHIHSFVWRMHFFPSFHLATLPASCSSYTVISKVWNQGSFHSTFSYYPCALNAHVLVPSSCFKVPLSFFQVPLKFFKVPLNFFEVFCGPSSSFEVFEFLIASWHSWRCFYEPSSSISYFTVLRVPLCSFVCLGRVP